MLGYCECIVDWFLWVLVRGVAFYAPWGLFSWPNQGNVNSRRKCDYHLGRNKSFSEGSIKGPKLSCIWEGNMVKGLTEFCGIVFTQINRHIALASVSSRFTFGYTSVLISPQPHHTTISNITQRSFYPFRFKIWKREIGMHQSCHSNSWGLGNCHWKDCNTFITLMSWSGKKHSVKNVKFTFLPVWHFLDMYGKCLREENITSQLIISFRQSKVGKWTGTCILVSAPIIQLCAYLCYLYRVAYDPLSKYMYGNTDTLGICMM